MKGGDSTAFKRLFEFYQEGLFWYCLKLLRDDKLAEDVLQEVFLRLWRNRENIAVDKSVKSYLYTAAHNLSLNTIRNNRLAQEKLRKLNPSPVENLDPHLLASGEQLKEELVRAIEQLPPKAREVFKLSRENGMSYKEIGEELNIGIKTVETHIGNALKSIRSHLKNSGFEL